MDPSTILRMIRPILYRTGTSTIVITITLIVITVVVGIIVWLANRLGTDGFDTSKHTMVLYHLTWCKACKRLMPTWKQFRERNKSKISVLTINVEDADGDRKDIPDDVGPKFPCVVKWINGKMYKYDGDRSLEDLERFAFDTEDDDTPEDQGRGGDEDDEEELDAADELSELEGYANY